jgi:hypothetical protein
MRMAMSVNSLAALRPPRGALRRGLIAGSAWGVAMGAILTALGAWNCGVICLGEIAQTTATAIAAGLCTFGPLAAFGARPSAPFPKFVIHCGTLSHELRKQRGTSSHMILVPLFDLKFLNEFAAAGVGTSNRRH